MQTVLIFVELIIAVAMVIFILLQRSEGGALGIGGGSTMGGLFSPRGAGDTLTRTTAILALLFFVVCLALNLLALRGMNQGSILTTPEVNSAAPKPGAPITPAPIGPSVPKPQ